MTIGFFAPLPIALMIPFMVAQSLAMMEAAGKGWQFGKRKISSLSNEEFNKLTPHKILEDALGEYKLMIPSMTQAFDESRQLQTKIIEVMVGYAVQILSDIEKGVTAALSGDHDHDATTTRIKNPFVSSFLTPAIIPPIPTENLIPLTDTHPHEPSTVQDFNEFQQQTAEDKRKQKLRDEAQERADKIKHIQLPSITPKFTDPKKAATATRLVITQSIHSIEVEISAAHRDIKALQLQQGKAQSTFNAILPRHSGTFQTIKRAQAKIIASTKLSIQNKLLFIGNRNVLLAKTRKLL